MGNLESVTTQEQWALSLSTANMLLSAICLWEKLGLTWEIAESSVEQ